MKSWDGRATGSRCYLLRSEIATRISTGFLRFRAKVVFRRNCRCPVALRDRIRRTARNWRTCRWTTRLKSGNGIGGGRTSPVWIARLSDSSVTKVPRENSNDFNPMWVDQRVFFLSDRNGPMSLFSYDTKTKSVTVALKNDGLDFKYASAGPDAIAIEQFGAIWLYDLKTGAAHKVEIRIAGDLPQLRPRYENVANRIRNADISPTGLRAVFEARGEILTVPAEKGDIRNLTNTPGADERYPAWSPDGKSIAYFSDESGEEALYVKNQNGQGEAQKFDLGTPGSFFFFPTWSPDSKKIAYTDKRLNLWYVDLEKKTPVKVFHDRFTGPEQIFPSGVVSG